MSSGVYLPKSQPGNRGWCGPTCLANALAIYGIPTSQEDCAVACRTGEDGTSIRAFKDGCRRFGFKANIKDIRQKDHKTAFKWLQKQTDAGKFVICGINGNYDRGHWILILRVIRGKVQVWDPNDDHSKLVSKRNLFKAWWNITSPSDPTPYDTASQIILIAMSPRSKLAKRAVKIQFNLVNPPKGELPVAKDVPESFEEGKDAAA